MGDGPTAYAPQAKEAERQAELARKAAAATPARVRLITLALMVSSTPSEHHNYADTSPSQLFSTASSTKASPTTTPDPQA